MGDGQAVGRRAIDQPRPRDELRDETAADGSVEGEFSDSFAGRFAEKPSDEPPRIRSGLVGRLNREWAELAARRDPQLLQWALDHPCLAGCRTLGDVLARISDEPDPVLRALLRLDRAGDPLAARVVLQTMVGKAVRMAHGDPSAEVGDYLAALWCQIRTYPLDRRPERIAANLALDTLKAVRTDRSAAGPAALLTEPLTESVDVVGPDEQQLTASLVLRRATALGVIDRPTRRLLFAVYAEGRRGTDVAQRLQLSHAMVRYRCCRAIRRLAEHSVALAEAA